jgi:hypothetical protein
MVKINFLVILVVCQLLILSCDSDKDKTITWKVDSTDKIGENSSTIWGSPKDFLSEGEKMVEFDGENDGLLVNKNPLEGMKEFTIEVDLKPYDGYPENREQRFLHIQDPNNENRRILMELRLNSKNEWYGDWFMKSGKNGLTLKDSTQTHPVNVWATISLVYKNEEMKGYINGKREVAGVISYVPIGKNGKTSIGTRMDKTSWFKGTIREVRFIPRAIY